MVEQVILNCLMVMMIGTRQTIDVAQL